MLVLSRRVGEVIMIGDDIRLMVTRIDCDPDTVRIGIDAPKDVIIRREEIPDIRRRNPPAGDTVG